MATATVCVIPPVVPKIRVNIGSQVVTTNPNGPWVQSLGQYGGPTTTTVQFQRDMTIQEVTDLIASLQQAVKEATT